MSKGFKWPRQAYERRFRSVNDVSGATIRQSGHNSKKPGLTMHVLRGSILMRRREKTRRTETTPLARDATSDPILPRLESAAAGHHCNPIRMKLNRSCSNVVEKYP